MEIWERTSTVIQTALNASRPARRRTWPRSASPTSARPPSSGTAGPAAPTTTPSSGRTPAPTASPARSTATAAATSSGAGPGCRRRRTSPAARSSGSWRTSTGSARPPSGATRSSAPPTPGCCGTSPAASDGGVHVTDVTNASRTMLMDLETLDWDDELLAFFGDPAPMLPQIRPSSDPDAVRRHPPRRPGRRRGAADRRPRRPAGGHGRPGVLRRRARRRTPTAPATSCCSTPARSWSAPSNGLLTTVCYQFGDEPAGLRPGGVHRGHRLGRAVAARPARHHQRRRARARAWPARSTDNGGVYFVPAFSGLFAPYWRSDARGAIVGLSRFNTNAHLARATLEAICYQSRDVVEAMAKDSGVHLEVLKVDGGVTANDLCMQIQADILGVAGQPAGRRGDHRARRGLRRRPGHRLLEGHRRAARRTGTRTGAGRPPWSQRAARRRATPAGRRRSSAPWTGWTSDPTVRRTARPGSDRAVHRTHAWRPS